MKWARDDQGYSGVKLEEFDQGFGATAEALWDTAFEDGIFYKWLYDSELQKISKRDNIQISQADAYERVTAEGLKIDIPEEGIGEHALNILIERKKDQMSRMATIQGAKPNFATAGGITLAAGFLDPANLAADMLVTAGLGQFSKAAKAIKVAKAKRQIWKAVRLRAGLGAAEGLLGTALIEPLNYQVTQNLGDDYTTAAALQNIAVGTVMGGGLHVLGGAVSDGLRLTKLKRLKAFRKQRDITNALNKGQIAPAISNLYDIEPVSREFYDVINATKARKGVEQLMELSDVESRQAYLKTALAQMLDDQPVRLEVLSEIEARKAANDLMNINTQLKEAISRNNSVEIFQLTNEKRRLSGLLRNQPQYLEVGENLNLDRLEPQFVSKDYIPPAFRKENGKIDYPGLKRSLVKQVDQYNEMGDSVVLVDKNNNRYDIVKTESGFLVDSNGNNFNPETIVRGENSLLFGQADDEITKAVGSELALYSGFEDTELSKRVQDQLNTREVDPYLKNSMDEFEKNILTKDYASEKQMDADFEMIADELNQRAEAAGLKIDNPIEAAARDMKIADEMKDIMFGVADCMARASL